MVSAAPAPKPALLCTHGWKHDRSVRSGLSDHLDARVDIHTWDLPYHGAEGPLSRPDEPVRHELVERLGAKPTRSTRIRVIEVHLTGTWLGIRAAASVMREQKAGTIINVSSMSGKQGNPGQTNYSVAKAGIVGMTKAAAKELGRHGVRVNAVQPGLIDTAMIQAMKPEVLESRLAEIPLGRLGTPEDVANVGLFLASDLSNYLTGNVIEVAGGRGM